MNFVTKFAVQTILKTDHPTIERRQCWNMRPHLKNCTACKDICPVGDSVFTRPSLIKNWNECIDCGLCVSVCKTRCIAPSRQEVERNVVISESDNDIVWIGCQQSTRTNDVVRACIGALSWEALAYLALCKKIVLDLTPCSTCENEECAALLRQNLERVVDFLGNSLFESRIALAYEQDELPYTKKEYSRRDLAGKLAESSKSGSRHIMRRLPFLMDEDEGHMFDYRKILHERLKQIKANQAQPPRFGFKLPIINDKCYGCDRCVRACRSGALELIKGEDNTARVVITAWKCSECELCMRACTDKAIESLSLRQVSTLGQVALKKVNVLYCTACGKAKKPSVEGDLCSACLVRERAKKRQEEAKLRAEKRAAEKAAREAEKAAQEAEQATQTPESDGVSSAVSTAEETPKSTAVERIKEQTAQKKAPVDTAQTAQESASQE